MATIEELPQRQAQIWLSLLRELTATTPDWFTMKGIESALHGVGDVDSIAPVDCWPLVIDTFHRWAAREELGPVVVCPHAPFLVHLVAVEWLRPEIFELDVNSRKIFFGSTIFRPRDVASMTVMDQRGFRRLRPGAEGVLKLIQNGSTRDGRPWVLDLNAKGVVDCSPQIRKACVSLPAVSESVLARWCAVATPSPPARGIARRSCGRRPPASFAAYASRMQSRLHFDFGGSATIARVTHSLARATTRSDAPEQWLAEAARTHEVLR